MTNYSLSHRVVFCICQMSVILVIHIRIIGLFFGMFDANLSQLSDEGSYVDHFSFSFPLSSWSRCKVLCILYAPPRSIKMVTNSLCMLWYFNFKCIGEATTFNVSVKGLPRIRL